MSLPEKEDLETMEFALGGRPFVRVNGNVDIDTTSMDYALAAQPFLGASASAETGNILLNEYFYLVDSASAIEPGVQGVPFRDTLAIEASLYLNEYVSFLDTVASSNATDVFLNEYFYNQDTQALQTIEDIAFTGSVFLNVLEPIKFRGTTDLNVLQQVTYAGSTSLNVVPDNLAIVTQASAALNPTETTVVIGGNTLWSFPATLPPSGLSNARCFVNYKCDVISNTSLGDLFSYNLSLTNQGGNFRIASTQDLGSWTLGSSQTLFGLQGSVTKQGREKTGSQFGWTYSGIFAPVRLNKQLSFLAKTNPNYIDFIPGQSLRVPSTASWKTYRDAAQMIAAVAGATLSWLIPDLPLTDFSAFSGQSGIQALSSLAEQAGGVLRWNGGTHFNVAKPTQSFGIFRIPDCCLIQSITEECNLDLTTGVFNPGIYIYNQPATFNAGQLNLPAGTANNPSGVTTPPSNETLTEDVFVTSKNMTSEDPTFTVDLPYDFQAIYIQILTKTDGAGTYVTTNPQRNFLLQTGFAGGRVNNIDVGGVLKPVILISPDLFPQSNNDVTGNHFIMKISVVRKNLGGAFEQAAKDNSAPNEIQNLARTQNVYKWTPVCTINAQVIWFGAMPIPGMTLQGELGDYSVPADAIIESVDFQSPGILNITAIRWAQLQFISSLLSQGES